MKGDFTRDTFNPAKHFLRVLRQQGRVELDADGNEQTAILLHYLQTLAADLIGPHGGPDAGIGFGIVTNTAQTKHLTKPEQDRVAHDAELIDGLLHGPNVEPFDFVIMPGRYYVDGLLVENDDYLLYSKQADDALGSLQSIKAPILFYLDVWERFVSYVEDDSIREVALGGADTAARTRVEWQIKFWPLKEENRGERPALTPDEIKKNWADWVEFLQPANRGRLRAFSKEPESTAGEPCLIHPDARYRGAENQLYRVEIHRSGGAREATFKWSRENGSVTFPLLSLSGGKARLAHLGRDNHLGLKVNDWVEIVDDDIAFSSEFKPLYQVAEIEPIDFQVTLKPTGSTGVPSYKEGNARHPYLRRWDHKGDTNAGGAILITESDNNWVTLEDNIQIQFPVQTAARYRAGDYWLIPARTATSDIEWPEDAKGVALALPPHGVEHHYAPLAIWSAPDQLKDSREVFAPIAK